VCPIEEPSPFDKGFYSHKINHAALKYEIGLSLTESRIVYLSGGVPAGMPDITLARGN
jgi:hypothetical protein